MITQCSKPGPLRGKSSDCPEDRHFCTLKNTLICSLRGLSSSAKIRACEGSVPVHMRAAIKHGGVGWCILGRRYAHPRSVENQWQCLALLKIKVLYRNITPRLCCFFLIGELHWFSFFTQLIHVVFCLNMLVCHLHLFLRSSLPGLCTYVWGGDIKIGARSCLGMQRYHFLGRRYAHPRRVENQWQCFALLKIKVLYRNLWTSGTFSCHKIFYIMDIMDNVFIFK